MMIPSLHMGMNTMKHCKIQSKGSGIRKPHFDPLSSVKILYQSLNGAERQNNICQIIFAVNKALWNSSYYYRNYTSHF